MNARAAFGVSILMSLLSSATVAVLFVLPWVRVNNSERALIWLVAPHLFFRFIGISFLVPGVVSGGTAEIVGQGLAEYAASTETCGHAYLKCSTMLILLPNSSS